MPMHHIFASPSSWIEGEAVRQLEQTATLPGVIAVAGMPDLCPGKGCPVGAVTLTQKVVYPHLIGNDIGCGYTLFATTIPARTRIEKLVDKLTGLDQPFLESAAWLEQAGLSTLMTDSLGTVGGGNHFAELQRMSAGDTDQPSDVLTLLVHSGSRALGEAIYRRITQEYGATGLEEGTEGYDLYVQSHDKALRWAALNRKLIGTRLLKALGHDGTVLSDIPHNHIEITGTGILHRKGAAAARSGHISPLPGSRGAPTYLLSPVETPPEESLRSLPHGAGRRYSRAAMHGRVQDDRSATVVCGQELLRIEEHPKAYKDIEQVVADVTAAGLATAFAKLEPVLTYKSEAGKSLDNKRAKEEGWRRDRRDAARRRR